MSIKSDKEEAKAEKNEASERYEITDLAKREGYPGGLIDGKFFVIIPAEFGKVPYGSSVKMGVVKEAQCFIGDNARNPESHKSTGGQYYEGLSFQQKHELLIAGIINLNEKQQQDYRKEVVNLHKPKV